MKLSISNIAWESIQDKTVYGLMKKYGFSGLEIAPTRIFPDRPYELIEKAAAWQCNLQEQYGFSIPSMQSIWFGRTENIFASEKDRETLLEYTKQSIRFASAIHCKNLVFGCPKNRFIQEGGCVDEAKGFFRKIAEYALAHRTVIGLEANPEIYHTNYINRTSEALQLIEELGSEGLRLNLDTGTMLHYHESAALLKGKISYVSHIHISEPLLAPIKERQLHQEVADLLLAEAYQGFVSIEMGRQDDLRKLEYAMQYISELFSRRL